MKIRLFIIDKKGCHHMMDIIKHIKIGYEMSEKFSPYLNINFIPKRYNTGDGYGVIIQAGSDVIKRNYHFKNEKDKEDLEKILWILLRKYHPNIPDITDKDGCIIWTYNPERIEKLIKKGLIVK